MEFPVGGFDEKQPRNADSKVNQNVDVESVAESQAPSRNIFKRMADSFKPPTHYDFDTEGMTKEQVAMAYMGMKGHRMSRRQIFVMSWCTGIGTGLFIGSGKSLKEAGPAGLLLGAVFPGIGMMILMMCVGELAARYEIVSPFFELPARFMDKSWGFACGWIYALTWLVTAPLEMIAGAMLTQFWHSDDPHANGGARVNPVAWIALIYSFALFIQLSSTRTFGELEFFAGCLKLIGIFGFIIYAIVIICGGGPHSGYIGGRNWGPNIQPPDTTGHYHHGFANGVKGTVTAMVSWAFAYGGTEISAIAAAEAHNPAKALPSLGKRTMWRVCMFFFLASTLASTIVPFNHSGLGAGDNGSGSMFVLSFQTQGIQSLASVFNALIIISVVTLSNAAFYAGSRTFFALAVQGAAPRFMAYVDRQGRPLGALIPSLIFALIAFVCASDSYGDVFNWMYAFVALGFLYVWLSGCVCFINVRLAMRIRGISTDTLVFKSPFGLPGAIIGTLIWGGILFLQFWVFIWPLGYDKMTPHDRAVTFFQNDLSVFVILALYLGHKIYYRTGFIFPKDIDPTVLVRKVDWDTLRAEQEQDKEKARKHPILYGIKSIF